MNLSRNEKVCCVRANCGQERSSLLVGKEVRGNIEQGKRAREQRSVLVYLPTKQNLIYSFASPSYRTSNSDNLAPAYETCLRHID